MTETSLAERLEAWDPDVSEEEHVDRLIKYLKKAGVPLRKVTPITDIGNGRTSYRSSALPPLSQDQIPTEYVGGTGSLHFYIGGSGQHIGRSFSLSPGSGMIEFRRPLMGVKKERFNFYFGHSFDSPIQIQEPVEISIEPLILKAQPNGKLLYEARMYFTTVNEVAEVYNNRIRKIRDGSKLVSNISEAVDLIMRGI